VELPEFLRCREQSTQRLGQAAREYAASRFAVSSPAPFINGIQAAREKIVARSDEDRRDFLRKRGLSKAEKGRIVETVMEGKAKVLLEKVV